MMVKDKIVEFVLNNHKYREKQFSENFSEAYAQLSHITFPSSFVFRQKLYHWIHDDYELKLGICPVCGSRCTFESLNTGYKHHCSKRCSTIDNDVKKKRQDTCMKKYGVSHESKSYIVKQKKENTCYEHFGVKYPQQCIDVRNKREKNNIEKYGVPHVTQNEEVKSKIKETCIKKYGVPYICMSEAARCHSNDSKPNNEFAKQLDNYGIHYEREFGLENFSYDFKINDILVEINPTITHNTYINIYGGTKKDKNYHINKTNCSKKHGYFCIHVWEWDDLSKIISMLKTKETLYARNLELREVTEKECNEFLNSYHLQNTCKGQTIRVGLYKDSELIQLMTFGKPRYNKKYEYELLRLCSHKNYKIVGGSEKLFKYFLYMFNPKSIISYCDNAKFNGSVYERLGFVVKSKNAISKHWYNIKTKQHITDNLLRQRGFDQLFGTDYGKYTSNEELMIQHGFLPVYDCGQMTFVFN